MQRSEVLSMRKKLHNNFGLEAVTFKTENKLWIFFPALNGPRASSAIIRGREARKSRSGRYKLNGKL